MTPNLIESARIEQGDAARYFVETWDFDLQRWTPQEGAPHGPLTKWQLRDALRALRGMSYEARRGDPSVRVYRCEEAIATVGGKGAA